MKTVAERTGTDQIRSFVAILLPSEVRDAIYEATIPFHRLPLDAKWVERQNYHLTLKFFGNLKQQDVGKIDNIFKTCLPAQRPMTLEYGGWGTFPPQKSARSLWLGLGGQLAELKLLWQNVQNEAAQAGYQYDEKKYHPHLTLARFRSPKNIYMLHEGLLDPSLHQVHGSFAVREINLMSSLLQPHGPVYESISSYQLRGI
jgi:2'-5' RNA ligase